MDCNKTINFLNEMKRLCKSNNDCVNCELCHGYSCYWKSATSITNEDFKTIIEIVQQWSDKNPAKTRQSEFLKLFPNVDIDDDGVINVCPKCVDDLFFCRAGGGHPCSPCRKKFWLKEIEVDEDV